jgi:hypothetical protein
VGKLNHLGNYLIYTNQLFMVGVSINSYFIGFFCIFGFGVLLINHTVRPIMMASPKRNPIPIQMVETMVTWPEQIMQIPRFVKQLLQQ